MAKQNNSNDSEKTWTVEKLRQELERVTNAKSSFPADLLFTSMLLWKWLPLELLPLLPNLPGVSWSHVDRKLNDDGIIAVWKDPWGVDPERELHVEVLNKDLNVKVKLTGQAGTTPMDVENLHQGLYLLTK